MDFYRELEKIDEKVPLRKRQEMFRYSGKPDSQKFPYRNSAHKSVGEYFPSINDKIKVIHYKLAFRIYER
jgi:hypothetical protein